MIGWSVSLLIGCVVDRLVCWFVEWLCSGLVGLLVC